MLVLKSQAAKASVFALTCAVSLTAQASLCESWSAPKVSGALDASLLPEASGLSASRTYSDRLYHINDEGETPVVYITDLGGKLAQKTLLQGVGGSDTEELALGPCAQDTCLYVGDIGDNEASRKTISISWLKEKASYRPSEKVEGRVSLTYPDGAHNAEGFVVHPDGDLYLFTKGLKKSESKKPKRPAFPSRIYRISGSELQRANGRSATLEFIGEIDVPAMLNGQMPRDQIVTGAAISDDGSRLALLTYKNVIELDWPQVLRSMPVLELIENHDYRVLKVDLLPQQEAIDYLPSSQTLVVTTESKKKAGSMIQLQCEQF